MNIPWDDEVTASTEGQFGRTIVAEGTLRAVIPLLVAKSVPEQARMLLRFPHRSTRPFEYDGKDIVGLSVELDRLRRLGSAK